MLVSVGAVKGGQGKTTWAVALASAMEAGLLDLDSGQGDAHDWATRAGHTPSEKIRPDEVVARVEAAMDDRTLWVADTPPGEGVALRTALGAAIGVLVPVGTGTNDLRGWGRMVSLLGEIRQKVNPDLKVCVVLNGVRAGCKTHEEALTFFRDQVHAPEKKTWFLGAVGLRQAVPDAIRDGHSPGMAPGAAGDEFSTIIASFAQILRGGQ